MDLEQQKPIQNFDVSAKAIIFHARQVLLLRRSNGRWDLPGGKARPGEHATDALQREVREETGLTVSACDQLSIIHRRRSNGRECRVVSYHCKAEWPPTGRLITLSSEHEDFAFFGFGQTNHLRLREYHKQAINSARHQVYLAQAA